MDFCNMILNEQIMLKLRHEHVWLKSSTYYTRALYLDEIQNGFNSAK